MPLEGSQRNHVQLDFLHRFLFTTPLFFIRYSEFPLEARTIVTSFQLHFASEMIIKGVILILFFFYKTALSLTTNAFKNSLIYLKKKKKPKNSPWFIFLFSWTLMFLSSYVFDEWMMLSLDVLNHPGGHIKITQWLSSNERQEGEIQEKAQALFSGTYMHLLRD